MMPASTLPRPGTLEGPPEIPLCGMSDLDHASPLRPGALTLVDAFAPTDVLYAWMADTAVQGRQVLVADGANFLDVYRLATAARRRAVARMPDAPRRELAAFEEIALERVRVARGFTAHQIHSIVEDGLAGAANEEVGLIVAPGLLDMYLDDELSRDEARTLAARALSALRRLAGRLHVPAIISNRTLSPTSDHPLRVLLEESIEEHVLLKRAPGGSLAIHLPRRGAAFLSPGPGRTRLEDFLEPEERATPIPSIPARAPGEWLTSGFRMRGRFGEALRREPWAVHEAREAGV